jgi:hypothetical protein
MIFGEHTLEDGSIEKGIFLSVGEFIEYRKQGWSSTSEINATADDAIAGERGG